MIDFLKSFLISPGYWPFFLAIIPVLVMIGVIFFKSNRAMQIWFGPGDAVFFLPEVKLVMRGVALLLFVVALLGPYWGRTEQEVPIRGREVYILIDVSASMNCEDIQPTRLTKVKRDLKKMIGQMEGDRVGLIVFTSDAYVQCPLTSDLNASTLFLDLVGTAQFSNSGTNFRSALMTAARRFAADSLEPDRKRSRSIVLISDGEDFGEKFAYAVDTLKRLDVTVFPVGVGTYTGAEVPEYRQGQKVGYKKAEGGGPAISQLKDETLQDLATSFGTKYFTIDDQFDNFDPILDQIKLLSSQELNRESRLSEVNQYQWFLGAGVLLFMITLFWMPVSGSSRSGKRG